MESKDPSPFPTLTFTQSTAKTTFGDRLRFLRKARGLTQTELATSVGIKQATVSSYEKGVARPSEYVLDQLASALGDSDGVLRNALSPNPMQEGDWQKHVTIPTEPLPAESGRTAAQSRRQLNQFRKFLIDAGAPDTLDTKDVGVLLERFIAQMTRDGATVTMEPRADGPHQPDMVLKSGTTQMWVDFKTLSPAARRATDQRRQTMERSLRQAKTAVQQLSLQGGNASGITSLLTTLTNRVAELEEANVAQRETIRQHITMTTELAQNVTQLFAATRRLANLVGTSAAAKITVDEEL